MKNDLAARIECRSGIVVLDDATPRRADADRSMTRWNLDSYSAEGGLHLPITQ